MKRWILLLALLVLLSGCATPTASPTATQAPATVTPTNTPLPSETPVPTVTLTPTATLLPTATPIPYPAEGRGPSAFAEGVNPLTGLEVADPQILQRRPVVVKVENLPREHRPQWGLNSADAVYEYYTEQGSTRFAAVFYGEDAEVVGPVRSARFFDIALVQMYKAAFAFGSAYETLWNRIAYSDIGNRIVLENNYSCPALCRHPEQKELLVANTGKMNDYLRVAGFNNAPQNLDGLFFQMAIAPGGQPANEVYLRYSGAIYNRWDWVPEEGVYQRYAETANDISKENPQYALLTDRNDQSPISASNVVTLCIPHRYFYQSAEIEVIEILPSPEGGKVNSCDGKVYEPGSGAGYAFRDGQMYPLTWKREKSSDLISLYTPAGGLYALKPGRTWYEVIGASSTVEQDGEAWKFEFKMAP